MKARILEAAGQSGPAQKIAEKILAEGFRPSASRPDVAQQAALLLFRYNRPDEALTVLGQAVNANPDNPDLLLERAIILALTARTAAAEQTLQQIETRWPEWDRAYVVHGLVFESIERTAEARRKLQTATALGSTDPAARCTLARLAGQPAPSAQCACASSLRELLFPTCR